jgi:hypothetical protein
LALLTESLEGQATLEWKERHLGKWKAIVDLLPPFFEPNNFFSVLSKGFELLSGRQPAVLDLKILAELRPLYNEEATKTQAVLLTNTLMLEYVQDDQTHTLHLALDLNDLQTLARELDRVKRKNALTLKEAKGWKVDLLTYGELGT